MKRGTLIVLFFLIILVMASMVSALRINEVELNPKDECRDCTEWLEIYSDEKIDLEGFKIVDKSGKSISLSGEIDGYYVINDSRISLNNENEEISLYNLDVLVDKTPIISDSYNDDRSWQLCKQGWVFVESSKNKKNNCVEENKPEENQSINETNETKEEENKTEEEVNLNNEEKVKEEVSGQVSKEIKEEANKEKIVETGNIIKLGKDIKSFKSKIQYIKEYSIYAFTLFCIILLILLIIKRRKLT